MASSAKSRHSQSEGSLLVQPRTRPKHHPSQVQPSADHSVLRPSISVSITGMKQAVKALENGSQEVRNYLLHECNVIYECRTCFNMFRSVVNYIAHKRSFCRERLQDVKHVYRRDQGELSNIEEEEMATAFVQPEAVETLLPEKEWDLAEYSPSLELLKEAGLIQEIETRPLVSKLHDRRPKLDRVVDRLKQRLTDGADSDFYRRKDSEHVVRLEGITQTSQAVFQTIGSNCSSNTMGQRYQELQRLKQRPCVFLGPDGAVIDPGPPPPHLSQHVGAEVGGSSVTKGITFKCPLCSKKFMMPAGVSRHLTRKHKKTTEEAHDLLKKSRKAALLKHHKSIYGNIRFGECSYAPQRDGLDHSTVCKNCSSVFLTMNQRLGHEILCLPEPTVRLERLSLEKLERLERLTMSVKLEKLPEPVIKKAISKQEQDVTAVAIVENVNQKKVDKLRSTNLVLSRPASESGPSLTVIPDDDDNEEVTFKKANEDKDSGIGNESEECSDETEVVDVEEAASSKRKRRRISGEVGAMLSTSKGKDQTQSLVKKKPEESLDRKKGLITGFFTKTERVKEVSKITSPAKLILVRTKNNR